MFRDLAYNKTARMAARRLIGTFLLQTQERKPAAAVRRTFEHRQWPIHDDDALVNFGNEEIDFLFDHFAPLKCMAAINTAELKPQWKRVKFEQRHAWDALQGLLDAPQMSLQWKTLLPILTGAGVRRRADHRRQLYL